MADPILTALAAYVARDRALEILAGAPLAREGVALIADISGFTPLTEALSRALSPAQGAEELTRALNGVFAPLTAAIHAQGGSVLKFAGDALIVWFGRGPRVRRAVLLRRALAAALAMQAVMARHGLVRTPAGSFTLAMKVGLAYGPALRVRLGDPARGFEDVIGGRTLDRMAEAEHHAEPGEVLADAEGLPELAELAELGEARDGFVVVRGLRGAAGRARGRAFQLERGAPSPRSPALSIQHSPEAAAEALRPYVPAELFEAMRDGRAQPAELRPVVSIFVQFAGIGYEAGAEAEGQLARYFAAAQRAAARYGGRVNRLLTGDKGSVLHLIFGAPRALEELERRAALCALELRRAAAELPFITAQRVGITVGRAFAGPVGGDERREYTVMGEAINRSARLMQRAAPGQLLVDATLAARLEGAFALTPLGAARLKGVAEPVELFELAGERTAEARPALAPVGRAAELAQLRARIDGLRAGAGGVAVLYGELGMGKSHLLAALRAEAGAGVTWAGAGAASYGPRPSGGLIAGALRELLALPADPSEAAQALAPALEALLGARQGVRAAPFLARLLGLPTAAQEARELESLGGEGLRWRLTELLRELVGTAAARGPVLLALDDVQWADPTSLDLLEALLPVSAAAPLLLLLAARPDAEGRPLALLSRLGAEGAATLALGPLSAADAGALVGRHAPALGEAEVALLVARGAGNPLFLVELARTAAAGAPLDELPDTVQGLVLAQLDRLPADEREALQVAAVVGTAFDAPLVDAVLETAETQGSAGAAGRLSSALHLTALEAAGFLMRQGAGYSFRHGLIRESAYAALLHARRRAWHGATAAALERLYPARLADLAGMMALHHEGAGDLLRAARGYGQAADGARLLYANDEADTGYQKALALLDASGAPDDELRARTFLKLAQVRMNAGDYAAAQELYDTAFALLEQVEAGRPKARRQRKAPVFRMGADEPETLDPALAATNPAFELLVNLFEGLVALDADLNIVPAAARGWRVEDGGLRYSFELRRGLRWSDGSPLTAADFVAAWQRNLSPTTEAPLAQSLYDLRGAVELNLGEVNDLGLLGIHAPDPHTLVVELAAPQPSFLALLSTPIAFPQPAHRLRALGSRWAEPANLVGNGPFVVTEWRTGEQIELQRNAAYRRGEQPSLERVRLEFQTPALDWAQREGLSWCRVVDRSEVEPRPGETLVTLQYLSTVFLAFSCGAPPFDAAPLRRALGLVLDQERLVQTIWGGLQQAALGGVVPPGIPGHSPSIGLRYDPEAGRQIWQSAAAPPRRLTLASIPGVGRTPEFLADAWRTQLGVEVRVVADLAIGDLLEGMRSGNYDLALLGWDLDCPDPSRILAEVFNSGSPLNFFGWANQSFDALIVAAASAPDQPARLAAYHEADRILTSGDVGVVPLYYTRAFGLLRGGHELASQSSVIRGGLVRLGQIVPTNDMASDQLRSKGSITRSS